MSNIGIKKGEVGNSVLEGKFIAPLDAEYVRGILRRLMPSLCVSHKKPAYFNGKWNWTPGWWVAIQDGIYLLREGNDFNLYWEEKLAGAPNPAFTPLAGTDSVGGVS